ncbi:MAG: hypothetical protein P4M00_13595 [Azospirillaceae bacterium]|nr:hypothetical protein [Azospirillaceae bacterium]
MGICALQLRWLTRLHTMGVLPNGHSIIELGPQDIYRDVTKSAIISNAVALGQGDNPVLDRFPVAFDLPIPPDVSLLLTKSLYSLFGLTDYKSLDFFDHRADFKCDLNIEHAFHEKFDCLTNFGTSEHCFDISMSFRNAHNLLRKGGLLLYDLPAYGDINHGFYNIHPIAYIEMALANKYEIVDAHYVDNVGVRSLIYSLNSQNDFDFDSLPIKISDFCLLDQGPMQRNVILNFYKNLNDPDTIRYQGHAASLIFDYCFIAMRKTSEEPFVVPNQRF